jgi:folate-binding protein YgfZ
MNDLEVHYRYLRQSAGVIDLSARSRVCVTGADRQRFINGQVTNNVKDLKVGQGCYAALVTAKGKMESDLFIYCLADELLLDFEPGLAQAVTARLEKYVIADDVQIVDVSGLYGMLSVQGPRSADVVQAAGLQPPTAYLNWTSVLHANAGEIYCMNNPRGTAAGFDVFVPTAQHGAMRDRLVQAAAKVEGGVSTADALDIVRIEAGIPRFGVDMDQANLAPEAGIEARAISYNKGCYIGQEVISRIRAFGQVAKSLRGLRLPDGLAQLPGRGEKLFRDGKEVGYLTSACRSPALKANIALGYVRREHNTAGIQLQIGSPDSTVTASVCDLPFVRSGAD